MFFLLRSVFFCLLVTSDQKLYFFTPANFLFFFVRKNPSGFELTSQRVRRFRGYHLSYRGDRLCITNSIYFYYHEVQSSKCMWYEYLIFLFFYYFFHLTYSRWTSSLPSCLGSQRIFPSLPGSRLTFFYRDASSALLQLVNQWLNFTYSRSHAFRYERKNTNPTLVRIELTTSVLADVQLTY